MLSNSDSTAKADSTAKPAKLNLDHFLMKSEAVMYLFLVQGIYYMITGIWPLLDIDSFMAVTGPKLEIWLVKTVGMLVLVSGSGFLLASVLRAGNRPLVLMAAGSALGFILIEVIYVVQGIISLIYLLDAVLQLILLLVWTKSFFKIRKEFLKAKKEAKQSSRASKGGSGFPSESAAPH